MSNPQHIGNKLSNECGTFVIWESYLSTRKLVLFAEIRGSCLIPWCLFTGPAETDIHTGRDTFGGSSE